LRCTRERVSAIATKKRKKNRTASAPAGPTKPPDHAQNGKVKWLTVVSAEHNNLKAIDVHLPLGRFVCVTGVSGSGKSSLVNDILYEALARDLNGVEHADPGRHKRINGKQHLDKVIDIDQSPIGRTPRSNPGTYVKFFDLIRDLFSKLPDSRARGYKPGRFSFNVPAERGGGRCGHCEGNGANKMEMDFLPDVWVRCPVCEGHRFSRETLEIRFRGASISEILEMDVQQALEHFENQPKIRAMLQTLHDVGLDYMKIGQPAPTLSGGEAQRIKLARELVKRSTGQTLYMLDEPTTGLHFDDIQKLLDVLHGFVDAGNTVVVIEHNLDVIKTADWIVDLGPEGGEEGGLIVAAGTPEQVAETPGSHTGEALRPTLGLAEETPDTGRDVRQKSSGANGKSNGRNGRLGYIEVTGAQQHNLKNIDVRIPRHKTTVCAGLSGSGKSSLALDTIYTEGQRRYMESLSSYARQFLGQLQKPKVEHISGLSPAISIEQKPPSRSPRSTVGTVTEIYDYIRVLYSRIGEPHCPECGTPIGAQTSDEIVDRLLELPEGTRLLLLAPVERASGETYSRLFERALANGFRRAVVDGEICELDSDIKIDHRRRHDVELVVDRAAISSRRRSRIADSVEQSLTAGGGVMLAREVDEKNRPIGQPTRFSKLFSCNGCGASYEPLSPQNFSFNSPLGWCESCEGLGVQRGTDLSLIVVRPDLGLLEGAIASWGVVDPQSLLGRMILTLAGRLGFDVSSPYRDLEEEQQWAILHGVDEELYVSEGLSIRYAGLLPAIDAAARASWQFRRRFAALIGDAPCMSCRGSRLRPDAAAVRLNGKTIRQTVEMPIGEAARFIKNLKLDDRRRRIAGEIVQEAISRLRFLTEVGLDYLTLDRAAPTLSNGESQRIRLASQVGSGLTGVLYVLDEPTIGLHPRDNRRLINALTHLRNLGNTVLMVEHDREIIESADWVMDFGPGAGQDGGSVVAAASPSKIKSMPASLTGGHLSGKKAIPVPQERRPRNGRALQVIGAGHHNLKDIDVEFPLGNLIAVTGVSGSGKSSLIHDILYRALARRLHRAQQNPGLHQRVVGLEHVDKVINVDQEPIGNTPSSNPATYTGVFTEIRELFARLAESRVRGYEANRFSFNRPGGRCEDCEGNGRKCIQMHFLPDVWVECESCGGRRYNPETLDVRYRGKNISEVLDMRIDEALEHFKSHPKIRRWLQTLHDVGLGYVQLGQPAPTLSGGESQRVKLAAELGRPNTGRTVYLLDEPTTGLHFEDLRKLLDVLHRLVDLGNSVIVIEHNLDLIKQSDWVIDLGPEAGDKGGSIVATGTPEQVAKSNGSHTGVFLKEVLADSPRERRAIFDPEAHAEAELRLASEMDEDAFGERMPWERHGRQWHTQDRVTRAGEQPVWDSDLVDHIIDVVHKAGEFAPTDWNHRTRAEVAPKNKSASWFLHLFTSQKWIVIARFRVAAGQFSQAALSRQLGLKTLDELPEVPIYGKSSRVRVRRTGRDLDEVIIEALNKEELDTRGFRGFIRDAASRFLDQVDESAGDVKSAKPWLHDGRKWHLSHRGMARPRASKWGSAVLLQALGLIQKACSDVEVGWNNKSFIALSLPSNSIPWGKVITNRMAGLQLSFHARPGQFNRAALEGLGRWDSIKTGRQRGDLIELTWQKIEDTDTRRFVAFARDCRAGWLETMSEDADDVR
jgi:excinuclease ABC subunit A